MINIFSFPFIKLTARVMESSAMTTPHVSNRLPRDLGCACVKMAGKVMDEHVMVSCLKRCSFHLCAFLLSWKRKSIAIIYGMPIFLFFQIQMSVIRPEIAVTKTLIV